VSRWLIALLACATVGCGDDGPPGSDALEGARAERVRDAPQPGDATTGRAGTGAPRPGPGADLVIPGGRFGPVEPDASGADLAAALGDAYAEDVAYLGEGFCGAGALLYGGTPDAIRVAFVDDTRALVASAVADTEGARWRTTEGVGVGTSLEELARLNGAPITFTGFGWDRGGTVIGYGGGALASYRDDAGFFVLLDASPRPTARALVGDHDVSSDDPALADYDVRVRGLEAQWRNPQSQDCEPAPGSP
jgi:hypothetical protein